MPQPEFVSVTSIQSNNIVSSVAAPKPSGAAAGQAWIVVVSMNAARTVPAPAGWAVIGTSSNRVFAYIRICDGTEGSTATFSWSGGSANVRAISSLWDYVNPTTPVAVAGAWSNPGAGTSVVAASITDPGSPYAILVSVMATIGNTTSATKPASMTQAYQDTSPTTFAAAFEDSVAGSTGTRTWTTSGSLSSDAMLFVLNGIVDSQDEFMGILSF